MILLLFILITIIIVIVVVYLLSIDPYHLVSWWNQNLSRNLPTPSKMFFQPEETNASTFHSELVTSFDDIRDELLMNLRTVPMASIDSTQDQLVSGNSKWQTSWLRVYNNSISNSYPRLSEILNRHPEVTTCMVSILEPGMELRPHHGPFKGILRYHLGLVIPEGEIGIMVGGETYRWREGEGVVFDDTYLHSAWNRTSERRIVLFADIIRPLNGWQLGFNQLMLELTRRSSHLQRIKERLEQ